MSLKKIFNFVLLLTTSQIFAQNIKGIVKDASNSPLEGVKIQVLNTETGTYSKENGSYELKVQSSEVSLKFTYVGLLDTTIKVNVKGEKTTEVNMTMSDGTVNVTGLVFVEKRVTSTENSLVVDIKKSDQVVNGVSSEQISKTQDRSASEVIRRVPGISIQDNRFVMVRGLNERYNSVWLDNTLPPSTEVDRRSFSFDQVPSLAINRIMVYKTAAPELPSDFAGAFIKVVTQNQSSNKAVFSYTTGFRTGTTFNDFQKAESGKLDFLGIDDGTRAMPEGVPTRILSNSTPERLNQIGKMFSNNWSTKRIQATPDQRINVMTTHNIKSKKHQISNLNAISYSNVNQIQNVTREDFGFDGSKNFLYQDAQYQSQTNINVIHNWSFSINPNHKIEFKNFYNQNGRQLTTLRTGTDYLAGSDIQSGALSYLNRIIYTGQLTGTHRFEKSQIILDWTGAFSHATRNEPDLRRYTYTRPEKTNDPFQIFIPNGSASATNAGRFYAKTNENIINGQVNFEKTFTLGTFLPTLKAGYYFESKSRNFEARVIGFVQSPNNFNVDILKNPIDQVFTIENINTIGGLMVNEITKPSDKYDATYQTNAAYLAIKLPITKKWNVYTGARFEMNQQTLHGKDANNVALDQSKTQPFILPSINTTYAFSEKHQLKFAFGQTINRPEFREIAPFIFYDFDLNSTIVGNPNLKIATIQNFDLRYEFYPTVFDQITIGGFYKNFKNPIEWVVLPGSGSLNRTFTFANAPIANAYGVELEVRKSLAFTKIPVVKNMMFVFNASVMKSKVDLGDVITTQEKNRQMQGQSPYLINGGFYYQSDTLGLQISALYNVIGPRIFLVGDNGYTDIYEKQRHVIDLTISKKIGRKFSVKAGVSDLLNQYNQLVQNNVNDKKLDVSKGDHSIAKWKRGSYYTLGITATL